MSAHQNALVLLRRFVALLSSATMLHLSVGQADALCAVNGETSHHSAAGDTRTAAQGHVHHAAAAAAAVREAGAGMSAHTVIGGNAGVVPISHSRMPVHPPQSRCCESMSTCSVPGIVAPSMSIASGAPDANVVMQVRADAPSPVPQAPEPPPPKA
jgi:hypothetical protein